MKSVVLVSTYPPRQCGIATYTYDVLNAIRPHCRKVRVVALDDGQQEYGSEVVLRLPEGNKEDYEAAATWINQQDVDLVHIQHEYGIFGGEDGCWLLRFLDKLRKPCVATFHTVLPKPTTRQREVLSEIGRRVDRVIVMSTAASSILQDVYGISSDRVSLVRHGAPPPTSRSRARRRLGIPSHQLVVSTFGLIGPGKGIEYAIEAVARVAARHPELRYYILGRTHPKLIRDGRDTYRDGLRDLVSRLGISSQVHFVDKYLSLEELVQWLAATDIYVTPYPGRDQITSGTLTYAVAAGCAVVSTPYLYARDLLADDRGVLVEFERLDELSTKLAGALERLAADPKLRLHYQDQALAFGKELRWPEIGRQHVRVYNSVTTANTPARPSLVRQKLATNRFVLDAAGR